MISEKLTHNWTLSVQIDMLAINSCFLAIIYIYSQTCIKRSPLGQRKSDLIRQVTSYKRFNLYDIFYDRTINMWLFNTGDCLIEVTVWAGLTVSVLNGMTEDNKTFSCYLSKGTMLYCI